MKYLQFILLLGLISIFIAGCTENPAIPTETTTNKYPMALNNEWNYQVETFYTYYGRNGIDSTAHYKMDWGAKVISTNAAYDTFSNVTALQLYIFNQPSEGQINYYINSEDGLLNVGGAGLYMTFPKAVPSANTKNRNLNLTAIAPGFSKINNTDSVYSLIRKVLEYPLKAQTSFNLFINSTIDSNFQTKRFVGEKVEVTTPAGNFECYEITGGISGLTDYVSLKYGLIKRVIISDSVKVSSEPNSQMFDYKVVSTLTSVKLN